MVRRGGISAWDLNMLRVLVFFLSVSLVFCLSFMGERKKNELWGGDKKVNCWFTAWPAIYQSRVCPWGHSFGWEKKLIRTCICIHCYPYADILTDGDCFDIVIQSLSPVGGQVIPGKEERSPEERMAQLEGFSLSFPLLHLTWFSCEIPCTWLTGFVTFFQL